MLDADSSLAYYKVGFEAFNFGKGENRVEAPYGVAGKTMVLGAKSWIDTVTFGTGSSWTSGSATTKNIVKSARNFLGGNLSIGQTTVINCSTPDHYEGGFLEVGFNIGSLFGTAKSEHQKQFLDFTYNNLARLFGAMSFEKSSK